MAKKKPTFEEALRELESIAERIEQGKIGLDESIGQYERGMALVQQCREILSKAELRIQQIQERTDGTVKTKPFEPPAEAGPAPSEPPTRSSN